MTKAEVTFILDFTQFFAKNGKSAKYDATMMNVLKSFQIFFGRLQKKKVIDLAAPIRDGDKFEIWITGDRDVLENMVKQFHSKPNTDDKDDIKFYQVIKQLSRMYRNLVRFSEIRDL